MNANNYLKTFTKQLEDFRDLSKAEYINKYSSAVIDDDCTDDYVNEINEPLSVTVYNTNINDEKIFRILISCWWPNVRVTLDTSWEDAYLDYSWWSSERFDMSDYYSEIYDYFNLSMYE